MTETRSPFENLCSMAKDHLAKRFPSLEEAIMGGDHDRTVEDFAHDILLHHKVAGYSFHRYPNAIQESIIGGVEPLLFEDLPESLYLFYEERLSKAAKSVFQRMEEADRALGIS